MGYYSYYRRFTPGQRVAVHGGEAPAWTPASPTSSGGVLPHTWHYAGSGALYQDSGKTTPAVSDGDAIGASVNQGSDVHDIVQATTGNKPTLKLNILNGEAVFRYDGGDYLQGAFNGALSQAITVFCVAKLDATRVDAGVDTTLHDSDDSTNRLAFYIYTAATPDTWRVYAGGLIDGGITNSNWNVFTTLLNGASSEVWQNGVSIMSGDAGAHNADGLTLGANRTCITGWLGDIAEILAYDTGLSDADKNEIGNYLATKFALSWTVIV